jgi:hypothetical protein
LSSKIVTVTKKELCIWLGLQHPGGKLDYDTLNSDYFNPEVLKRLNISPEEYKRTRKFDAIQSQKIIDILNLRYFLRSHGLL